MESNDSEIIECLNLLRPPVKRDYKTSRFGYFNYYNNQPHSVNFLSEWRKPRKRNPCCKRLRRELEASTSLILKKKTSIDQAIDTGAVVSYSCLPTDCCHTNQGFKQESRRGEKPVIQVIVIPNEEGENKFEKRKLSEIISKDPQNQTSSIETKNVYLVVVEKNKEKIYEIKTTDTCAVAEEVKEEDVGHVFNGVDCFKQFIKSLTMEKKRHGIGNRDGMNVRMNKDNINMRMSTEHVCRCSSMCAKPVGCCEEVRPQPPVQMCTVAPAPVPQAQECPLGSGVGRNRVTIHGQLGINDEDRFVMKCAATVDDQPVVPEFFTIGAKASGNRDIILAECDKFQKPRGMDKVTQCSCKCSEVTNENLIKLDQQGDSQSPMVVISVFPKDQPDGVETIQPRKQCVRTKLFRNAINDDDTDRDVCCRPCASNSIFITEEEEQCEQEMMLHKCCRSCGPALNQDSDDDEDDPPPRLCKRGLIDSYTQDGQAQLLSRLNDTRNGNVLNDSQVQTMRQTQYPGRQSFQLNKESLMENIQQTRFGPTNYKEGSQSRQNYYTESKSKVHNNSNIGNQDYNYFKDIKLSQDSGTQAAEISCFKQEHNIMVTHSSNVMRPRLTQSNFTQDNQDQIMKELNRRRRESIPTRNISTQDGPESKRKPKSSRPRGANISFSPERHEQTWSFTSKPRTCNKNNCNNECFDTIILENASKKRYSKNKNGKILRGNSERSTSPLPKHYRNSIDPHVVETSIVKRNRSKSPIRPNVSQINKVDPKKYVPAKQKVMTAATTSRGALNNRSRPKSKARDKINCANQLKSKTFIADNYKRTVNNRVDEYNKMSPKHDVSKISVNIDSENECYDVSFHQGLYTTDIAVRQTSKVDRKSFHKSGSLQNLFCQSNTLCIVKNTSDFPQVDENRLPENNSRFHARDSLEISHRHLKTENETQTRKSTDNNMSVSNNNLNGFAPIKHFTGDNCTICDPIERDKEIRELLGIPRRISSSQKHDSQRHLFGDRSYITQPFFDDTKCKAVTVSYSLCSCCCINKGESPAKLPSRPKQAKPKKKPKKPKNVCGCSLQEKEKKKKKDGPPTTVGRTNLYQQLILNRNIQVFLEVEQFCKQKPICLSKKQYDKVKKTIQSTLSKNKHLQAMEKKCCQPSCGYKGVRCTTSDTKAPVEHKCAKIKRPSPTSPLPSPPPSPPVELRRPVRRDEKGAQVDIPSADKKISKISQRKTPTFIPKIPPSSPPGSRMSYQSERQPTLPPSPSLEPRVSYRKPPTPSPPPSPPLPRLSHIPDRESPSPPPEPNDSQFSESGTPTSLPEPVDSPVSEDRKLSTPPSPRKPSCVSDKIYTSPPDKTPSCVSDKKPPVSEKTSYVSEKKQPSVPENKPPTVNEMRPSEVSEKQPKPESKLSRVTDKKPSHVSEKKPRLVERKPSRVTDKKLRESEKKPSRVPVKKPSRVPEKKPPLPTEPLPQSQKTVSPPLEKKITRTEKKPTPPAPKKSRTKQKSSPILKTEKTDKCCQPCHPLGTIETPDCIEDIGSCCQLGDVSKKKKKENLVDCKCGDALPVKYMHFNEDEEVNCECTKGTKKKKKPKDQVNKKPKEKNLTERKYKGRCPCIHSLISIGEVRLKSRGQEPENVYDFESRRVQDDEQENEECPLLLEEQDPEQDVEMEDDLGDSQFEDDEEDCLNSCQILAPCQKSWLEYKRFQKNKGEQHVDTVILYKRDLKSHKISPFVDIDTRQTMSSMEVRYANIAYIKQVTFSSVDVFDSLLSDSSLALKDPVSIETLFKGHTKCPTPNLGTSTMSCVSEPSSPPVTPPMDQEKPKRPFLRRLISCLVMRSDKTPGPNIGQKKFEPPIAASSLDSYHFSTSLGAIDMTSSLYDTSASFYSNHSVLPQNTKLTKRGFLSSVRGFLYNRRS